MLLCEGLPLTNLTSQNTSAVCSKENAAESRPSLHSHRQELPLRQLNTICRFPKGC